MRVPCAVIPLPSPIVRLTRHSPSPSAPRKPQGHATHPQRPHGAHTGSLETPRPRANKTPAAALPPALAPPPNAPTPHTRRRPTHTRARHADVGRAPHAHRAHHRHEAAATHAQQVCSPMHHTHRAHPPHIKSAMHHTHRAHPLCGAPHRELSHKARRPSEQQARQGRPRDDWLAHRTRPHRAHAQAASTRAQAASRVWRHLPT